MTTRITLAILLTTWVVLIIGEAAAFFTARQILLALLDDTIITRATAVVQGEPLNLPSGDQYQIRGGVEGTTTTQPVGRGGWIRPTLVRSEFVTTPEGHRFRTIELKVPVQREGKLTPVSITYSRPAEMFDKLLSHLASVLLLISLACGLTTAWLALKLSRASLRPLRETADVIAQIDEQQLSTRIKADDLPVELAPMAKRLNEMLERLQSVFQQRKQFLADAAHELRTPTAALLTTLEVALRRPRDQAALLEALQSGLADARRLRKLVESLMEQARGEQKRRAAPEMTDIAELVRECTQIVTPLAREKELDIHQELPETLNFPTERDRLRSVVLNLLTNAIEYNRPGGNIRVSCARDNGHLLLSVADTGVGISPEQMPHVFEPFYRGGITGRGDDAEHLGLGLFLVRSHVQSLHGECHIESKFGEGTTMRIKLPEPPTAASATSKLQTTAGNTGEAPVPQTSAS
jgi:signal transduction histidine kinase